MGAFQQRLSETVGDGVGTAWNVPLVKKMLVSPIDGHSICYPLPVRFHNSIWQDVRL